MTELDVEDRSRSCAALEAEFFADRALIIAANRAPVSLEKALDGTIEFLAVVLAVGGVS